MKTDNIYATRRKKGQILVKRMGSNVALADKIDRAPALVSGCFGNAKHVRNVGDKLARHIEKCLDLPEGWMDTSVTAHDLAAEAGIELPDTTYSVPLIEWRDIKKHLNKRLSHKKGLAYSTDPLSIGSFALTVIGDEMTSMQPGSVSYPNDSIIFVDTKPPSAKYLHQKAVILQTLNGCQFGIFSKGQNGDHLKPLNMQYPVKPIQSSDVIIGIVTGVYIRTNK